MLFTELKNTFKLSDNYLLLSACWIGSKDQQARQAQPKVYQIANLQLMQMSIIAYMYGDIFIFTPYAGIARSFSLSQHALYLHSLIGNKCSFEYICQVFPSIL